MRVLLMSTIAVSTISSTPAGQGPADSAAEATRFSAASLLPKLAPGANACLSPYSIQSALAMTYAGAAGETKSQMAAALGFPADAAALAGSFAALDAAIQASSSDEMAVHTANRLFGARGFQFREAFLEICKTKFGAPLDELDFKKDPGAATRAINKWVEQQTRDRIANLVPDGALTRDTTLVLANALYLKMPWQESFRPAGDLPFQIADAQPVPVPAIRQTARFGYDKHGGFTIVSVPFKGSSFLFCLFLPESDKGDKGDAAPPKAANYLHAANLPQRKVSLTLPKFRLEPPTIALGQILQSLGMTTAFDIPPGSADFDAMAPRLPDDYLYISEVFHKTFFDLDENGVEAAAATAVVMMRATAFIPEEEPVKVFADRPFYFAVLHPLTGACLFAGRLTDPRR